jgi:hypothetical protein
MSEVHVAEHSNTGRAVKAMHWFATIGSPTERSGRITTAKSGLTIVGLVVGEVAFPSNRYVLDNSGAARSVSNSTTTKSLTTDSSLPISRCVRDSLILPTFFGLRSIDLLGN